ncbi:MAG: DUF4166 domain-containing protein [Pseudomonadota bacterium]
MKVAVLGGYGVFGALLCELLIRDGHQVAVVGRSSARAAELARRLDADAVTADIHDDVRPVIDWEPGAIVDAVGPFQDYPGDPYLVPRACIAAGIHYLDLSDSAKFTAGIATLNDAACQAGVFVLSGCSSVPGLSSTVVDELAQGRDDIRLIDTAILPGNRAPRGLSVMASIVGGVGRTSRVRRGGIWRKVHGWTQRRHYRLAPDMLRAAYFVEVPDIRLFPARFNARSVMFRAGLELGIMNRSLAALAWLRRWHRLPVPVRGLRALKWMANQMLGFGSDRGGMQVSVTTGDAIRRTWTLIAEAGDGPYVPTLMARALLRQADEVPAGARACLAEIPVSAFEEVAADLAISTTITEAPAKSLFQQALADKWQSLPAAAQNLHSVFDVESFSGRAEIVRGTSLLSRLIAAIFRFPLAGADVPVTVTKTVTQAGETWERRFADRSFRSYLTPATEAGRIKERFLFLKFELDLPVENRMVEFQVRRGWAFGVPIPRFLLPRSESREFVKDGRFHFDIELSAPLAGLVVRYRGSLAREGEDPATP